MKKSTASKASKTVASESSFALLFALTRFLGYEDSRQPAAELEAVTPAVTKAIEQMLLLPTNGDNPWAPIERDIDDTVLQAPTDAATVDIDKVALCVERAVTAGFVAGWRVRGLMSEGGAR